MAANGDGTDAGPAPALIVTGEEVKAVLTMEVCMDAVRKALVAYATGASANPLRSVMRIQNGFFGAMPAATAEADGGSFGTKVISVYPGNHGTAYESHQGVILVFEQAHGSLVGIVDAAEVTAVRTAAASGVATAALAAEGAAVLAIIGTGKQAMPHLEAMMVARPGISTVKVFSRNGDHAAAFVAAAAAALDDRGVEVIACETAEEAVRGSDIVCTLTGSPEPVVLGDWLAPGVHVNAVGSCTPRTAELDIACFETATHVYTDSSESLQNESGGWIKAVAAGAVAHGDEVLVGLVIEGTGAGRQSDDDITVFKSLGLGVEDIAAADLVLAECRSRNLGTSVTF